LLTITDIGGNAEALTGYRGLQRKRNINGEKTLAFLVLPTPQNAHSYPMVSEESVVEFDGEPYRIKQLAEKSRGTTYYKEVVAVHTFFDLIDEHVYALHTGSMTFQAALQFVLGGTEYTWSIVDTFYAQDFENFGDENRLALFQTLLVRYGAEFTLNGTHITFRERIGNATDFQFRYNYNVKTITRDVKTSNLSTYIKGFGKQNDDGTYVVESEYTSPNATVFGLRHAKPVRDERYTTLEGLNARLQAELIDVPEVSITIDFADLRRAGFPFDVPTEGDDVFLIYEPIGIDVEARLVDIDEEFTEGSDLPIKTIVTLGNIRDSIVDRWANVEKQVNGIIGGDGKVKYNVLDAAVKRATEALQRAETELEFENGIIARSKINPNHLVLLNSAGVGISSDGGQTFREAITADGFVLSAGAIGQLAANNIRIGPETTFDEGYNPQEIIVASKNMIQNSGNFENTNDWTYNGGTTLEVVEDNGRNILHCRGSIAGSGIGFLKPNTEYIFSAELYFNKPIDVTYNSPLHFWVSDGVNHHIGLESAELISTINSIPAWGWHTIAIKIKTKASLPAGVFFKPFVYDPTQIGPNEEYWVRSFMFAEGNKLATWSPAVESIENMVVGEATKVRNDLRLSAPLPTQLFMDQNGISAHANGDPNKYARLDYRGLFIKQGAIQIERPDGYQVIQDGILRNSFAIQGSEPPFQTDAVQKVGQFYMTQSAGRFENIQRFTFKHDSRYVRIIANMYALGNAQAGNIGNMAFDVVTDDETTSITSAVVTETGGPLLEGFQGYRKDILLDLGVPTGNLYVMYWRMWNSVVDWYTYGSVRYIVQEG
jgi:phage minor structural protein